jgi:hypothetical protein
VRQIRSNMPAGVARRELHSVDRRELPSVDQSVAAQRNIYRDPIQVPLYTITMFPFRPNGRAGIGGAYLVHLASSTLVRTAASLGLTGHRRPQFVTALHPFMPGPTRQFGIGRAFGIRGLNPIDLESQRHDAIDSLPGGFRLP